MGRADRDAVLVVTVEQRLEVEEQLRRRDLGPRVRERLEMVKGVGLGQGLEAIVAWSGRSERTVLRWLRSYQAGGVGALGAAPRSGRPARANEAYMESLERAVESSPRDLGLGFDVWTSARLSAYLEETEGVRIAPGWLRALLSGRNFRCGRPKHSLRHLRDAEEVARCEAELAEVWGKGGERAGGV